MLMVEIVIELPNTVSLTGRTSWSSILYACRTVYSRISAGSNKERCGPFSAGRAVSHRMLHTAWQAAVPAPFIACIKLSNKKDLTEKRLLHP